MRLIFNWLSKALGRPLVRSDELDATELSSENKIDQRAPEWLQRPSDQNATVTRAGKPQPTYWLEGSWEKHIIAGMERDLGLRCNVCGCLLPKKEDH